MRIWFGLSIVYIFTRYFGIFSGIPGIFDIFVCDRFSYRRYGYEENTRYTWYIDLPTDLNQGSNSENLLNMISRVRKLG